MTFHIRVADPVPEQEIYMCDPLKTGVQLIIHKTSSYLTENRVYAHWTSQSMVHREITALYCETLTKHMNK